MPFNSSIIKINLKKQNPKIVYDFIVKSIANLLFYCYDKGADVKLEIIMQKNKKEQIMIEFRNVSKTYETGTEAVHNANFKIEKGEFAFLVGSSGSRKININ